MSREGAKGAKGRKSFSFRSLRPFGGHHSCGLVSKCTIGSSRGGHASPMLPPPSQNPQEKQSRNRAARVNQHVVDAPFPVGHEGLMPFIARRVEQHQFECQPRRRPTPGARILAHGLAQRAPAQQTQHCILRQVRAFADEEHEQVNRGVRHPRKQPAQDRFDDA